jgi:hypothetical protein
MQSYWLLKQAVHVVTNGLWRIKVASGVQWVAYCTGQIDTTVLWAIFSNVECEDRMRLFDFKSFTHASYKELSQIIILAVD